MPLKIGQKRASQNESIKINRLKLNSASSRRGRHKAGIEIGIMRNYGAIADKFEEAFHCLGLARRALNVAVCYAGKLRDLGRDVHAGVNEGVERFFNLASCINNRAYLGHAVEACVEAGGLNIEGHHFVVHISVAAAVNGKTSVHVVDKIALAAVDDLNAVLFAGLPHIGECLQNAVVCDGYGRVSPICRALNYSGWVGQSIERGETGMRMQLNALFLGVIRAYVFLSDNYVFRLKDYILVIAAVGNKAVYYEMIADVYLVDDRLIVLGAKKFYNPYRACEVCYIKAQHGSVALFELAAGDLKNIALDSDTA